MTPSPLWDRLRGARDALVERARPIDTDLSGSSQPTGLVPEHARASSILPVATLQTLVDALPDATLILDERGMVIVANPAAHGVITPLILGAHIGNSARQPELADAIRSAQASGQKSVFELTIKGSTERRLDGAVSKLVGFGHGSGAPALMIILQDISEREALARMRMEFVANASHELLTPLAALSGFIETLQGPAKSDPAAQVRFLGIMGEQAQRMTRLIDDLLLLSRMEMRAHLTPTVIADLNHVATECIRLATPQALRERTTLSVDLVDADTKLQGDHDELIQAVQNLLQNANKYGRPKGSVAVRTTREQDRRGTSVVRLSVIDDGPGIAAEHLPRLTERFYRVSNAVSREKGGTGLDLAIVKHIAARHGGRVEVQSSPGAPPKLNRFLRVRQRTRRVETRAHRGSVGAGASPRRS